MEKIYFDSLIDIFKGKFEVLFHQLEEGKLKISLSSGISHNINSFWGYFED